MAFRPGISGNPNGAPKGHKGSPGRQPDWLRERCRKLVKRHELVEYLADVAKGKAIEPRRLTDILTGKVTVVMEPASTKDRTKAVELLLNRGWGFPAQTVESDSLNSIIETMRQKYLTQ